MNEKRFWLEFLGMILLLLKMVLDSERNVGNIFRENIYIFLIL